jgi:GNAT superfamily N-acetyltransferase
MKRIHRIVVRPDYQGVGLGVKFMSEIAKIYAKTKHRVTLVTSAPSFIHGLQRNNDWVMTRKPGRLTNAAKTGVLAGTTSDARLTATFEFRSKNAENQPFAEVTHGKQTAQT